MNDSNREVINKIAELYQILYEHDGYGEMTIEMRILKREQKEIIIRCGCQHRYVVDWSPKEGRPGDKVVFGEDRSGIATVEKCEECIWREKEPNKEGAER